MEQIDSVSVCALPVCCSVLQCVAVCYSVLQCVYMEHIDSASVYKRSLTFYRPVYMKFIL